MGDLLRLLAQRAGDTWDPHSNPSLTDEHAARIEAEALGLGGVDEGGVAK
jgi:hypothetical protein